MSSFAKPINHYEDVRSDTEWVQNYRPGGFHPVYYDDVFNARYRGLRKLGFGASSTVWLCMDEQMNRYVALKILTAKSSAMCQELHILKSLDQGINTPAEITCNSYWIISSTRDPRGIVSVWF
ncbi:MAG: CMGC SRPK kinase [Lasallia pustulata]|uniref:non-specific serine/threonine protein kinase n=1 Tax=Lasallia pustulata TaxID=136370 RepID=A0A5M8Q2K3_9LECA|nr:MAG: CMGC SRPK kinase [Lasallia pustulata]